MQENSHNSSPYSDTWLSSGAQQSKTNIWGENHESTACTVVPGSQFCPNRLETVRRGPYNGTV